MNNNPFSLPGRPDPWEPLDPLGDDSAEVLKQYVAVDNTEEAFVQFKGSLPGPPELTRRGQLVVAMGIDGGGKSSLINRCAWEARRQIEDGNLQAVLVDARDQAKVTDQMERRIAQVAEYVAFALERKGMVTVAEHDRERLRTEPVELYSRFRYYLEGDSIALVRLPRTERIEEIVQYAQLSHARLIFFAELGGAFGLEAVRSRLEDTGPRRPIILEVGPLKKGHGAAFVEKRFELSRHANVDPKLGPEVVEKMISSRGHSIREFQKFLYLMYERLGHSPNAPSRITWRYVLEAYYQMRDEL
jgi:hypothetical protein